MRITADTNVLVRAITEDDGPQSAIAQAELANPDGVALTAPTLCELVWVLSRGYKTPRLQVAQIIRRLINAQNVTVDRLAAEAGLAQLDAGGDFADGVIAHEGEWLGAGVFVSFDKAAVNLLQARGRPARSLS